MPAGLSVSPTCSIVNLIGLSNVICTSNQTSKQFILTNFTDFIPSTVPVSFDLGTINNGMVSGS